MNHYTHQPNPSAPGTMHLPALLAATFAALVGAVVWGLIAWMTGYEVGYVAWGIGLLVGFAAVKLGGHGVSTAATAAGLTLVAIFVGKVLGTHFLVEKEFAQVREEFFTAGLYEELDRDADAWREMPANPDEEDVREFMVAHNYGGFEYPDEIAAEDLEYFRTFSIPVLRNCVQNEPSFEEWQEQSFQEYRAELQGDLNLASLVFQDLNAIDLIFAFLAVSTAYGMITRASGSQEDQDQGDQSPPYEHEMRRAA